MVDVTKSNFKQILDSLGSVIDACDFIAIDLELSGLNEKNCKNQTDVPQTRFARYRKDVLQYRPIQVGIALFECNKQDKQYKIRVYNFYLFPHHESHQFPECQVNFNSRSMNFLATYNFDFNKMVQQGIPYVSAEKEEFLLTRVKERRGKDIQEATAEILDFVGFTKVIKLISESRKTIVGHNMILDILHLHHSFFAPVPEDYQEFKKSMTAIFPRMCDTKVLATTKPFKTYINSTALENLYTTVTSEKPFKKPPYKLVEGYGTKYNSNKVPHEAGYDAFMTGIVFAGLLNYLGTLIKPPRAHIPCTSELITPFVNKVFLMRMMELYYMDLSNDDVIPTRSNAFHLSFSPDITTKDILSWFQNVKGTYTQVSWINDRSCFVNIDEMKDSREEAKSIAETAAKDVEDFKIMYFSDYFNSESANSPSKNGTPHSVKDETKSEDEQKEVRVSNGSGQQTDKSSELQKSTKKRFSDAVSPENASGEHLGKALGANTFQGKKKKLKTELS